MIEKYLHWVGKTHGVKWAALRYFNAAGAALNGAIGEDHDPESHLIPSSCRRLWDSESSCPFSEKIIRRQTEPASGIIFTSSIWLPPTWLPLMDYMKTD